MKITNIYKTTAALIFLMVAALWPVAEAWGQVSGNKYSTLDAPTYTPTVLESDFSEPKKAFDGSTGNNNYASKSNATDAYFNLAIGTNGLSKIEVRFSTDRWNTNYRPNRLKIYSRDDGSLWGDEVQNVNLGNSNTQTITLNTPITKPYVRLEFTSNNSKTYRISEITLTAAVEAKINHKRSKWFDLVDDLNLPESSLGTFKHDEPFFETVMSTDLKHIQAAHTYMDTIYVHKGSSVSLALPTQSNSQQSSVKTYQRWYSYRTDGTFETNHSSNKAYDLLTPSGNVDNVYRLANGYVGQPLGSAVTSMNFYYPTDDEFKAWFDNAGSYDNDWYVVACDVSGYSDFWENYPGEQDDTTPNDLAGRFRNNGYYEPTLALRAVFYIVGVDDHKETMAWTHGHKRLKDAAYQGGGTASGKKYLEEYDITFHAKHLSNRTSELVALSKNAKGYAIPDVKETASLSVELENNNAGLQLETTQLSGDNRIIKFRKQGVSTNTPWEVTDGSTATILVTKSAEGTTYNIARYNLTFKADALPLTQTQVSQLGTSDAQGKSWNYTYRSPQWMESNLELLTSLNFDYDPNVAGMYGQEHYFPFPMNWGHSSYAFFDGSKKGDFTGATQISNQYFAEWGYYAIVDDYMGYGELNGNISARPPKGVGKDDDGYFLFIDTSDRPGIIARLPFEDRLCAGSELFTTAWIKSSGTSSNDDAAVMFTIMGVENNPDGTVTYTPIYRHSSSQIRTTTLLTAGDPGTGSGHNEWYQVYFSFINNDPNVANYDSYMLQIENNSGSTNGGDMYIDDVRVYLMHPNAEVNQLNATCVGDRTLMNVKIDWERLMSRMGYDDESTGVDAIDFCFVDKIKYDNYLAENPGEYANAIDASVVEVGNNEDPEQGGYNEKYNTLNFKLPFNDNIKYDETKHPNLAKDTYEDGKYYFYRTTDSETGLRSLVVDFYSALTPNRPYVMLINIHDNSDQTLDAEDFAAVINDQCAIKTDFYVTSETLLRVNGEVIDPATDFCAGKIFNFSAQMRVPVPKEDGTEDYIIIDNGVYFDWFFGTEEEFLASNSKYGGESLQNALTTFRDIYLDKEDLTDVTAGKYTAIDGQIITLTQNQIGIIAEYLNTTGSEGGLHKRLVLHKENLDVTLLQDGLQLVIQPIKTIVPPEEGGISEEQWAAVCWSYIPLILHINGDAPQLHAGFNTVNYPSDDFNPGLRIGLKQIESTSAANPLVVNLRGAKLVSGNANCLEKVTSLDPDTYDKIYLIGTDDPQYSDFFTEDFDEYSLPIGILKSLHAEPYKEGSSYKDEMEIYFDTNTEQSNGFTFTPREGYSYRFAVHFEEHNDLGAAVGNLCLGVFNVDMKVVPEYLIWSDTQKDDPNQPQEVTIGNWNYDGNWKRIASTTIHAATNKNSDYFTDGNNSNDNGFVPMHFTKVIMPKDSKVELYAAGANGRNWISYRPPHIAEISDSIQYDLMAFDHPLDDGTSYAGQLKTERYRVSLLDEIHFEPGAEMLHAEYLLYDTAWVDYQLDKGRWYTLASPLKAVYAGDFYTDSITGTEESEYFQPIYYSERDNNRFSPSVYQRGWKGNATLQTLNSETKDVAVSGNWSALYNDVAEAYTPGTGFSLKVQDLPVDSLTAIFRLPKADGSYTYYSQGRTPGEISSSISRDNAYRLKSDELYERNININASGQKKDPITISLPKAAHGDYYLVGNPFIAHLDMDAFLEGNSEVIEPKYWAVDDGVQNIAVVDPDTDTSWTTQEGATTIAPLQSFFVQKKADTSSNDIKFTQEMQTLGGNGDGLRSANALTITATTTDGRTSRAAVAYDMAASADYEASEDAELFLDSNLGDVPMVYTVAGTMATSINRTSELYNIPLGVYGNKQEMVPLSFGGLNQFSSATLYDAQEQTETPLHEGKTISVPAGTSGRYFLRAGTPTGNEVIARNAFLVYSVGGGKVMVTSLNTPLKDIRVYTMGGAQVRSIQASGMQQEIYLNRGIYLITVSDQDGLQETRKVLVR